MLCCDHQSTVEQHSGTKMLVIAYKATRCNTQKYWILHHHHRENVTPHKSKMNIWCHAHVWNFASTPHTSKGQIYGNNCNNREKDFIDHNSAVIDSVFFSIITTTPATATTNTTMVWIRSKFMAVAKILSFHFNGNGELQDMVLVPNHIYYFNGTHYSYFTQTHTLFNDFNFSLINKSHRTIVLWHTSLFKN